MFASTRVSKGLMWMCTAVYDHVDGQRHPCNTITDSEWLKTPTTSSVSSSSAVCPPVDMRKAQRLKGRDMLERIYGGAARKDDATTGG